MGSIRKLVLYHNSAFIFALGIQLLIAFSTALRSYSDFQNEEPLMKILTSYYSNYSLTTIVIYYISSMLLAVFIYCTEKWFISKTKEEQVWNEQIPTEVFLMVMAIAQVLVLLAIGVHFNEFGIVWLDVVRTVKSFLIPYIIHSNVVGFGMWVLFCSNWFNNLKKWINWFLGLKKRM